LTTLDAFVLNSVIDQFVSTMPNKTGKRKAKANATKEARRLSETKPGPVAVAALLEGDDKAATMVTTMTSAVKLESDDKAAAATTSSSAVKSESVNECAATTASAVTSDVIQSAVRDSGSDSERFDDDKAAVTTTASTVNHAGASDDDGVAHVDVTDSKTAKAFDGDTPFVVTE
jgi:hypothetical protein